MNTKSRNWRLQLSWVHTQHSLFNIYLNKIKTFILYCFAAFLFCVLFSFQLIFITQFILYYLNKFIHVFSKRLMTYYLHRTSIFIRRNTNTRSKTIRTRTGIWYVMMSYHYFRINSIVSLFNCQIFCCYSPRICVDFLIYSFFFVSFPVFVCFVVDLLL